LLVVGCWLLEKCLSTSNQQPLRGPL
jgi:hypothetical protein